MIIRIHQSEGSIIGETEGNKITWEVTVMSPIEVLKDKIDLISYPLYMEFEGEESFRSVCPKI